VISGLLGSSSGFWYAIIGSQTDDLFLFQARLASWTRAWAPEGILAS